MWFTQRKTEKAGNWTCLGFFHYILWACKHIALDPNHVQRTTVKGFTISTPTHSHLSPHRGSRMVFIPGVPLQDFLANVIMCLDFLPISVCKRSCWLHYLILYCFLGRISKNFLDLKWVYLLFFAPFLSVGICVCMHVCLFVCVQPCACMCAHILYVCMEAGVKVRFFLC